ncbi:dicarboxylate carrier protein [Salpingoeca rosetta]|uniref:Dicarboxylate carrier protein n=1 Tax=Salpingoeca rosetta (strain ATCC 50818 / BSB-021) TaxID=946362 RepID=F2UPT7_SALR5|nr:dicarboxylate carrier protein [Salpingoeca rosetta]EGD79642.1 dicarboxylate carrier protein [Salpingoeca rosetta]|eukprot:XP_004988870.1 dicarboxylate carrier protein [Salpingoeca rosetta]
MADNSKGKQVAVGDDLGSGGGDGDDMAALVQATKPELPQLPRSLLMATCAAGTERAVIHELMTKPHDLDFSVQQTILEPEVALKRFAFIGNALVRIIREEGIGKLYSGLGPNVIRAMLMTAGQLASYDTFKQLLLTTTGGLFKDNLVTHFTASTLAGGVATLLTQPVDVVKTRVMAATPGTYSSALQCAGMTLKQEGPLAFFRGMVPAFTRLGPQTILTFVFLEQLRRLHYYLTHGDDKPV